ncbi:MAG: hypothetical protein K0S49_1179 [Microbacterium sp.]|nr:hypothetical protein [Microbacterium sp.]
MFVRRHAVAALVVVALLTSGCGSPASPPTLAPTTAAPSPTDSAAAAYAAAEATYRAYVDALNAVDLSDPTTFEPVYALTLLNYNAQNVTVSGNTRVASISPSDEVQAGDVRLAVCLDVSAVEVRASDGKSLVSPERLAVQSLLVTLQQTSDTRPVIVSIEGREGGPTC